MATASRAQAFRILLALEQARTTLADLLAGDEVEALPSRDRGFLHELLLGTLRHRGALDHALRPLLSRPIEEIDPAPLAALRLGAYQVLRMRLPHRAAVMESVGLARSVAPRSAGFVNAVLRRLAREGQPPAPDPKADPLGWLTTTGSLPDWLARRWVERLGPEPAVARAVAFLDRPPSTIRLNPRAPDARARLEAAGIETRALAVPGAWRASGPPLAGLAAEGIVYVQDQGSQLVAHLAASKGLVLDAYLRPRRAPDACRGRRGLLVEGTHPVVPGAPLGFSERGGRGGGCVPAAVSRSVRLRTPGRAVHGSGHDRGKPRYTVATHSR
jgi:16S rRNA (cytosine967-C5)-methyltransferase